MDQMTFALIGFGSLKLLIPQRAIATIEMIDGLDRISDAGNAVANLSVAGRQWPVFAPDAGFGLQASIAETSKYCVAFDVDGQAAFAFACDEVSSLTLVAGESIDPLPECLRGPGSPFQGMLLRDGQVMFFCSEQSMNQYLVVDEAA